MKKVLLTAQTSKRSYKKVVVIICLTGAIIAGACAHFASLPEKLDSVTPEATTTSTQKTTEATSVTTAANTEETKETVKTAATTQATKALETTAVKKTTEAQKAETTKKKTTTVKKEQASKKDYLDTSKLTGTQDDVGKVVGYTSLLGKDIVVVSVVERTSVDGLKVIETSYSFGSNTTIVECEYCHEFPCPNGGGENCSQYNAADDAAVTCQICGKPRGNGYNGTCKNLIDWANGGKISCNHYD